MCLVDPQTLRCATRLRPTNPGVIQGSKKKIAVSLRQLILTPLLLAFLLSVQADWCDMQSGTLEQLRNSNPGAANFYEGDWSDMYVLDLSHFDSRTIRKNRVGKTGSESNYF